MISLLARLFIKPDLDQTAARKAYGILCGAVGIGLNLLLFAGKFLAGLISGSIAVTADAFNNLSDAGRPFRPRPHRVSLRACGGTADFTDGPGAGQVFH